MARSPWQVAGYDNEQEWFEDQDFLDRELWLNERCWEFLRWWERAGYRIKGVSDWLGAVPESIINYFDNWVGFILALTLGPFDKMRLVW